MVMIFHSYVNVYQRVYQPILVGAIATPLKNMTSSVGMIIPFPTEWKVIKIFMVPQTTNQVWFSFTPRASSPKCWTNGFTWCDVPINVQWFSTPLSASINFKCVLAYISINIYHLPFLFVVQKKIISLLWFIMSFFRSNHIPVFSLRHPHARFSCTGPFTQQKYEAPNANAIPAKKMDTWKGAEANKNCGSVGW